MDNILCIILYNIMYNILLPVFCSSVDGQLGALHILAIIHIDAVNIHVPVCGRTYVFISLGYLPRN